MERAMAVILILLMVLFNMLPVSAFAQQIVPPGQFRIGGQVFSCGAIPAVIFPGGSDIATATPGAININWPLFSQMPLAVQAFVYAHECAHHLYGTDENVADCWAVKIGRNQGFIDGGAVQQICQSVWISPGDWTHFPGPIRCQNMTSCFSQP
jgi:hypothetical protein